MSKKIIIPILVIIALLIAWGGVSFFTNINKKDNNNNNFSPFGVPDFNSGNDFLGTKKGDGTQNTENTRNKQILKQLSITPAAGVITSKRIITTEGEEDTIPVARIVERSNGNVYDVAINTGDRFRVSNTTIPKIYEVFWKNDATGFLARFLDDEDSIIKTFSANIIDDETNTEEGSLDGVFLEDNIKQITLSPDNNLFYLTNSDSGPIGIKTKFNGDDKKQIINLQFTEWLYQWVLKNKIFLTTKSSFRTLGYMYSLDIKSGTLKKIIGGINGLTTLSSNDGVSILYSKSTGVGIVLSIYNTESKDSSVFSLITLPEKCVWASDNITLYCGIPTTIKSGEYPDDWYKGKISFSDSIWKFDTEFGLAELLVSPAELLGVEMDVIKPTLDTSGKYLVFINKKDLTVWALDL